jgi:hypothetical protein
MHDIINRYIGGESTKTLAECLGISRTTLLKLLRNNGVFIEKRRGFKTNPNLDTLFFSKIDNEIKSYTLGLMYSDGSLCPYVSKRGTVSSYKLRIRLQSCDIDVLRKISLSLCNEDIVKIEKRNNKNWSDIACLQIGSIELGKDLIKLGCTPNKSATITLPTFEQVPKHLYRSFMRGFFDGDGGCSSKPPITASFTSNEVMCNQIRDYFMLHGINFKPYRERKNGYGSIVISGRSNCYDLYKFLYEDSTISLDRKRDRLINVIKMSKTTNMTTEKIKMLDNLYPTIV